MTQKHHYQHDNSVGGANVVPVHQAMGSNIVAQQLGNSVGEQVGNALVWSTAPYKDPNRRKRDSDTTPKCAIEDCKAFAATRYEGVCSLHGRWGWRSDGTKMTAEEFAKWKADRGYTD